MAISAFAATAVKAQDSVRDEITNGPTAIDHAAAAEATVVYRHAKPANTPAGATLRSKEIASASNASSTPRAGAAAAVDNDGLRFEGDLTYNGGAVVLGAQSHPIYMLPNGNSATSP